MIDSPKKIVQERPIFSKDFSFSSSTIKKIEQIQLLDGSYQLDREFADLFWIDKKIFDDFKVKLDQQGLKSFGKKMILNQYSNECLKHFFLAPAIQNEILRVLATGLLLYVISKQIPEVKKNDCFYPFDAERFRVKLFCNSERISSIFHSIF